MLFTIIETHIIIIIVIGYALGVKAELGLASEKPVEESTVVTGGSAEEPKFVFSPAVLLIAVGSSLVPVLLVMTAVVLFKQDKSFVNNNEVVVDWGTFLILFFVAKQVNISFAFSWRIAES
jgi:hypothetical protein